MSDFLSKIVGERKLAVERDKAVMPAAELEKQAAKRTDFRSLSQSLSIPGTNRIIAEVKRASPSKGPIRPDLDPAALASAYTRGGAAAISVLTEPAHFLGSIEDMQAARAATSLPVLRKEFIVDPYQIVESAAMGADAILLIVRILDPARLSDLFSRTRDLGMEALVEIHSEEEIEAATKAGATLIGINNRDLKTFHTDLSVARRLASRLDADQIPIAASGVTGPEDVKKSREMGISCFLVGEHAVRSDNPEAFVSGLVHAGVS